MRHPSQFVDAEVRIRGACGAIFNNKLQLVGILLYVPGLKQIEVLKPPADPFTKEVQPIETVARFAPERSLGHRIRVQGVVTLQDPARPFICPTAGPDCASNPLSRPRSSRAIAWMSPVSRTSSDYTLTSRTPSAGASGTRRR